jgi:ATP-binding cassette, subfamily C, type I secretion system permease/ATPase
MAGTLRGFYPVIAFSFVFNILMLVSPIYMMQVFDRVLTSGRTETLLVLTVVAIVALLILGQMDTYRTRILTRIGVWVDQALSLRVLTASLKLSLGHANVGSQPLRDLAQVRSFLASPAIFPIIDAVWVPVFLAAIFMLHMWLGLLAVFGAVALFGLALANEFVTRAPLKSANEAQVAAFSHADKTVRNAEIVEAMGLLPNLLTRWAALNNKVLQNQSHAGDRAAELSGATKFIRMALQIGILGLGAYLVLEGRMTSGGMIAGSILLGRGLAPIEQSISAWKAFVGARSAFERLEKVIEASPAVPPRMALTKPTGHLSVEGLSFVPPGSNKPILRNISFDLKPGEAMAIIGPSAAGKSSLCRMLVGVFAPTAGSVRLDGAEVSMWDRSEFGRNVGYLPQSVDLFDGTVAENIARMGEADSLSVIEAARLAGVHDMILRLPDGYDTKLSDGGSILSGGQRQRIGLARALFGDPCLLVLDEPNSNLDQEGEVALMATIDHLRSKGTAIVMVAHRSSVISHVDKLVVLANGTVQMSGPCDEVVEQLSAKRVAKG